MKNKQQIVAYLKATKPGEIKDELAIESFLARKGIYVKFDKSKKTGNTTHTISFEDFEKWFEQELPEKGDVIVIGGAIGIAQGLGISSIILGVSLTEKDALIISETEIPNSTSFRKANKSEMVKLQRELNKKELYWNKFNNKLTESIHPANNLQLRISLLGERLAIGVLREINEKGEIIMYCMKENDKPVRDSLYEVVGKVSDYQLEPINNQERKMLADELEKAGKIWNGHAKRIEPVNFRVEKGEIYYYIDDFWDIVAAPDNYRPKDKKRMRCGNYFSNRDAAEKILALMTEERNQQLVNIETLPKKKGQKDMIH